MPNLIVSATTEWNGKALKQGSKDISSFEKGVSKLGKTLAAVFATDKLVQFGKDSIKVFLANEASAVKLSKAVDNLGLSFSNPEIAKFVSKLSEQSGIVQNDLRPALQSLLTTTGDVTKSQTLLQNAIDISRGSTVDLSTVAYDLSQAYVGNYKGLKKYELGLTNAQMKTAGFTGIMEALNKQFSGASAAYLDTYAGKMDILKTAADEAKTTIGKGLVDALVALGGQKGNVEGIANVMKNGAQWTADFTTGVGALTNKLITLGGIIPSDMKFGDTLGAKLLGMSPAALIAKLGKSKRTTPTTGYGSSTGTMADYAYSQKQKQDAAAKIKADAKNLAIQKSLNVVNQKNLAAQKQSALTAKQALLFNQNAISEVAALKGKLSDEERKKVELMLALEVGNTDQAAILSQQVAQAYDQTGQLAAYLRDLPDAANPFAYWDMYLNGIAAKVNSIAAPGTVLGGMNIGGQSSGGGSNTTKIPTPVVPTSTSPMDLVTLANQGAGASGGFSPVVAAAMAAAGNSVAGGNQNITLTITGGDAITNAIADSLQNSSLSTGNAAYINRRTGGFE
jgi:hypothetical protein